MAHALARYRKPAGARTCRISAAVQEVRPGGALLVTSSDRHAPESYAPDLADELRDAADGISAQDAYYDCEPPEARADIPKTLPATWSDPWQDPNVRTPSPWGAAA